MEYCCYSLDGALHRFLEAFGGAAGRVLWALFREMRPLPDDVESVSKCNFTFVNDNFITT